LKEILMIAKLRSTILLMLVVSLTTPVAAQDDGSNHDQDSQAAGTQQPFIDVDFQGGTISDYIALLRTLDPNVRILCSESAVDTSVPTIKIKAVPTQIAVHALSMVSRNSFRPIAIDEESFEDANHHEGLIFTIDLDFPSEDVQIEATVVNAKEALRALRSEDAARDLQKTIEMGLSTVFDGNDGPAVVANLHEPTGLLFVKGPGERVRFVLEIIDQLSRNSD
jgi:hypothetical protein